MNRPSWIEFPGQLACASFVSVLCSVLACGGAPDESQDEPTNNPQAPKMKAVGQSLTFGGHDYLFVTTPRSWYDARNLCMSQGYHLVSVDTSAEEAFLHAQESRLGWQLWWLGFNDIAREAFWVWEGLNSINPYTNWAPGEPNNNSSPSGEDEDCAQDGWTNNQLGQWHDYPCSSAAPFICEKNPVIQSQGSFTYSVSNTSSATVNTYEFTGDLPGGRILTVGTCGLAGASGTGDTYLRLYNSAGQQIAANDDAGGACGTLSNISIAIPSSGRYTLRAGCYSNNSCSGTVVYTY